MAHWIYIEEGTYLVHEAFLLTSGNTATPMEEAVLEVYRDGTGERRVRGSGMATSMCLVELLDDYDDIDLMVDLGDEFKFYIKAPLIKAGKALEPDLKSLHHFVPQGPLQQLSSDEYQSIRSRLSLIGHMAES